MHHEGVAAITATYKQQQQQFFWKIKCGEKNFNFILVTAQTHGFQKTVMFSRESLCPSFDLTITISLHILQPPRCCYTSGHSAGRRIQLGGSYSPSSPAKSASNLWEGEAATTLPTHGPSADPSQASWRGDATFPSAGPNITEMLGRVSHQEGKQVVHKEILQHHHLGYHRRGLRPHHPIQPWAQQLSARYCCSPVRTTLPCNETLLGLRDACR